MKKQFFIGEKQIGAKSTFIIAEAGVNHNGELKKAIDLVDAASRAGADAVKFQTFSAEQVVTSEGEMAAYQKKNTGQVESQHDMLKSLELPNEFYAPIIKRCKEEKILFLSTPHGGKASVDFLESLGMEAYKIGSGDLTNFILLNRVAQTKRPIILSSGMATLSEVQNSISFLRSRGNSQITVLHCTTNYPCPLGEVNLLAMRTMMENLDVPVGYSDHTQGVQAAIMAVTMGAVIYECHFTLDKNLPGPDHIASRNPEELKETIEAIRNIKVIFGNPEKKPTESEKRLMIEMVRKSIVAARDLSAGHTLIEKDLEAKRPGDGTSPMLYEQFIGRKLKKDAKADQKLSFDDLD